MNFKSVLRLLSIARTKCELGFLFKTKMPAPLRVRDCILVRVTDKGYIECLNKDNYDNVWFIIGRNTEIVPQNQCFQVPIVEVTGSRSCHLRNISSAPNKHTLIRISIKSTHAEEEESGRGEGCEGLLER